MSKIPDLIQHHHRDLLEVHYIGPRCKCGTPARYRLVVGVGQWFLCGACYREWKEWKQDDDENMD